MGTLVGSSMRQGSFKLSGAALLHQAGTKRNASEQGHLFSNSPKLVVIQGSPNQSSMADGDFTLGFQVQRAYSNDFMGSLQHITAEAVHRAD